MDPSQCHLVKLQVASLAMSPSRRVMRRVDVAAMSRLKWGQVELARVVIFSLQPEPLRRQEKVDQW